MAGVAAECDNIQELADRTATGSSRAHYSPALSGAAFDDDEDWIDAGAVNAGSPAFDFGKAVTDVMTGNPGSIKSRHIASYSGSMAFELLDYNDNAFNLSVGTQLPSVYIAATTATFAATVATGTHTRQVLTLTTINTNLKVGNRLKFTALGNNIEYNEVKEVAGIDGTEITLKGTLSEIPTAGVAVTKVRRVDNVIGGNKLKDYQLRMLVSFDDGSFLILHSKKGNFTANTNPNYEDGVNVVKMPLTFGLIGQAETIDGFDSKQLVLARHHQFYPV